MQKYIVFTVLATCLMALSMCAIAQETVVETWERTSDGNWRVMNYPQILEDTDIMAKIIDRALEKKWPKKYEPSTLFRQSLGCQGFYLKDYGFVFMTNINFPVAKQEELEHEQPPTDDLWLKTKRELRGAQGASSATQVGYGDDLGGNYDAKRVSLLKEELLTLIGEYGTRMRQLNNEENIVIVVRGVPRGNVINLFSASTYWDMGKLSEPKRLTGKAGQSEQKGGVNDVNKRDYEMPHITYQVKEPSDVEIRILDASENVVRTIDMGHHDGSDNRITIPLPWDGKDEAGKKVKPGSYKCVVDVGGVTYVVPFFALGKTRPKMTIAGVVGVDIKAIDDSWAVIDTPEGDYTQQLLHTVYSAKSPINTGRTTLVVRVSREDIASYKDGSLDLKEFAKKAEITQY